MENEKLSLKKKLEAVECDYEMQLQALQKDIMSLRKDLSDQKRNQVVILNEKNHEINDVMRHNEQLMTSLNIVKHENTGLSHKLIEFEEKVNNERISMHEHVFQLELLKSEVGDNISNDFDWQLFRFCLYEKKRSNWRHAYTK